MTYEQIMHEQIIQVYLICKQIMHEHRNYDRTKNWDGNDERK